MPRYKASITVNEWHFLTWVVDNDEMRAYNNGKLIYKSAIPSATYAIDPNGFIVGQE
jgi:hypothetical protein